MNLEPLTRLIESSDFLAFREIGMEYLKLRGYRDVELRDGPNDGGSDFAVAVLGGNPAKLAIQITVQRDWKAKVTADCKRAKDTLGLDDTLYITSRRLPQVEFGQVADQLWEQHGISVQPADSQAIAGLFFAEGKTDVVLRALGISPDARRPDPVPRPDLKEDAAYSFVFFGGATETFRNSVIEQAVLSCLTRPEVDLKRASVAAAVVAALQLEADQEPLVSAAIDRMLQSRRITVANGTLSVDEDSATAFRAMRSLREIQWQALGRDVDDYLAAANLGGARLERASAAVMAGAGSLFLETVASASAAVGRRKDAGPLRAQLRRRMRELTAALVSAGLPESDVDEHLQSLATIVSNSDIGRVLMAGELFCSLASMKTDQFQRALGAQDGRMEVYLDASVAIPMIAGLLFEPAQQRFSWAASRIYELARRRDIALRLPKVYLEEAASHIIQAQERYEPLLGTDDDLRFSTNAFVAHFTDLTRRGVLTRPFFGYASDLGYRQRTTSFLRQRDAVMDQMRELFYRYGVTVVDLSISDTRALRDAQTALTFTAKELHLTRRGRLLSHDAQTVAYFMSGVASLDVAQILCTWDNLHLSLRAGEAQARWQSLDPVMLSDLFVLTRVDAADELMTTIDIAMELREEDGQKGARVLDELVRIEREGLHDAELLRLANEFKNAYMQALRDNAAPDDFTAAWSAWKSGDRDLAGQPSLPL